MKECLYLNTMLIIRLSRIYCDFTYRFICFNMVLLFVSKPGSKPKMGPNLGPFLFSFVQASSSQARAQYLQGRTHQKTKKLGPKQSQPHRAQRPANEAAAAFSFLPRPELHGPTADPFHPRVCSKVPSANSPLQLPSLPHQTRKGLTPCPIAFCPSVRH